MKNEIKKILTKVINLWQSNNQEYKNMKIGGVVFLIFGTISLFLSHFCVDTHVLITNMVKYTFLYLAILMFCMAIDSLIFYFYVYNNISHFKRGSKYFLTSIIILLILTLIIGIPFMILAGIIIKFLDFRAKKIDNLKSLMFYLLFTIFVICACLYPSYVLAYKISILLEGILKIKFNFNLDTYSLGLFIFISLLKLEVDAFYRTLLFIKQKKLYKSINMRLKVLEKDVDKTTNFSNYDIKAHIENKSDILNTEKNRIKKEISYDITYLRNSLRRIELAILIICFVMIALKIVPKDSLDFLNEYQGDTINVLTIYTLIMLYFDKRKEWK